MAEGPAVNAHAKPAERWMPVPAKAASPSPANLMRDLLDYACAP